MEMFTIILLVILLIVVALLFKNKSHEKFIRGGCGGCTGPSYIHSPWRWTYDGGFVKYA